MIKAHGEQIKKNSAEIEQLRAAREEAKTEAVLETELVNKRYAAAIAAAEEERLAEVAAIQQQLKVEASLVPASFIAVLLSILLCTQVQCEEIHKALKEKAEKARRADPSLCPP